LLCLFAPAASTTVNIPNVSPIILSSINNPPVSAPSPLVKTPLHKYQTQAKTRKRNKTLAGNNNPNAQATAAAGVYQTRTVLIPGTDPFCIANFTINWDSNGNPSEGQPITWWRAFTNPTQYVEPTNPTAADLQFNLIPNKILGILYYHQEPFKTLDGGKDVYTLPDGTTRTSASQLSDQAWSNLGDRISASSWPTTNVIG
jgi:hypothetical protein